MVGASGSVHVQGCEKQGKSRRWVQRGVRCWSGCLHCKKYDSLRKNSKFISEIMHDLGIGADTVKHILNPQTKQNCKSVAHFIDDALHVRKSSINK